MPRVLLDQISAWNPAHVLSVLGPTGSGKTSTVLDEVRRRFPGELHRPLLVSIDSVAVFRGLDIGSAKATPTERDTFRWSGLDLADPDRQVTAADFLRQVLPELEDAHREGRPIILVGGSHFYERALVDGMSPGEASDANFVAELEALSSESLHARLLARDARWSKIHLNDRYRLVRYLDLTERQGLDFDSLQRPPESLRPWKVTETLMLGIEHDARPSPRLRERIREMFANGWLDEVRGLLARFGADAPGLQTVGYREIVRYLRAGETAKLAHLEEEILVSHRQLAKKQRTWLRGMRARIAK